MLKRGAMVFSPLVPRLHKRSTAQLPMAQYGRRDTPIAVAVFSHVMARSTQPHLASIPRLGLGTYGGQKGEVETVVYEALKTGYRHLDCASIYGNEEEIGRALQRAFREGVTTREEVWITSKVWNNAHAPEDVVKACKKTLKDLQLDSVDLYLVHWPLCTDRETNALTRIPLSRTWAAMEFLVDAGFVRHIGVSNFDSQLLNDLLSYCRIRPYANQVECHVYLAQNNLLKFCERERMYLTAYCPLARAGRPKPGVPVAVEEEVVRAAAAAHQRTPGQVLLRWHLQRSPYVVAIPKTSTVGRLAENLNVFDFELTEEEMRNISALNRDL